MAQDDTPVRARHLRGVRNYEADQWPAIRAKGKTAFLIRNGLLMRGLPLGSLMAFVVMSVQGAEASAEFMTWRFAAILLFCVGVFTASGSLAARASWSVHERRFPSET